MRAAPASPAQGRQRRRQAISSPAPSVSKGSRGRGRPSTRVPSIGRPAGDSARASASWRRRSSAAARACSGASRPAATSLPITSARSLRTVSGVGPASAGAPPEGAAAGHGRPRPFLFCSFIMR